MPHKTNRTIIIVLFVTALVVRLIALTQNSLIANDGTLYITLAKLYSAGDNLHELLKTYPFASFFTLLIISLHKIIGNWILAGQLVAVLCGSLTVIPLYLLARMIFDEEVALFASIFYIICPNLVRYSTEILRNIPFIFFYMVALFWGYKGIKDGKMIFLGLSALFIVLSALLRIEGLILFVSLSIFLFWKSITDKIHWKKIVSFFGVFFISTLCILILVGMFTFTINTSVSAKKFLRLRTVSTSIEDQGINKIEREVERIGMSERGRQFFYLAKDQRFILYLSHIFTKTIKVLNIFFVLFLVGMLMRRKKRYRRDEVLLFVLYAGFVSVFLLHINRFFFFSTRYALPLVVPSLIWSGVGFIELKERLVQWIKARDFSLRDLAIRWVNPPLLIIICVPLLCMAWAPQRKEKLELKEIGLWLKEHGYAHSIIMGQYEFTRLAFYADAEFIDVPKRPYDEIIKFARKNGADLLIINQNTINHFSPRFLSKLSPHDLERINISDIQTPYYATAVFRLKGTRENKGIESVLKE